MYPEAIAIVKELGLENFFIVCKIYLNFYVANAFINCFIPIVIKHLLSSCLGFASNQSFYKEVSTCKMHCSC